LGKGEGGWRDGEGGGGPFFFRRRARGFITSQKMSAFFPTYLDETRQNKKGYFGRIYSVNYLVFKLKILAF
jgi:hypothetical protein